MGLGGLTVEVVQGYLVSTVIGALTSLAIVALKVLPGKMNRDDVERLIREQPLQFQFQELRLTVERERESLEGIWKEITGLRSDVVKLTTTLELMLRDKV